MDNCFVLYKYKDRHCLINQVRLTCEARGRKYTFHKNLSSSISDNDLSRKQYTRQSLNLQHPIETYGWAPGGVKKKKQGNRYRKRRNKIIYMFSVYLFNSLYLLLTLLQISCRVYNDRLSCVSYWTT